MHLSATSSRTAQAAHLHSTSASSSSSSSSFHDLTYTHGDGAAATHASLRALLTAIDLVTPLPTSPPTSCAPSSTSSASSASSTSTTTDKTAMRRERNRLSCRKTRLKRKIERVDQSLLERCRHTRQAELLDLRDELSADVADPQHALRLFITKNLHYGLLDNEYMAAMMRRQSRSRVGWPKRTLVASMETQWRCLTGDVRNVELTIRRIEETGNRADAGVGRDTSMEAEMQCVWTLRGVSQRAIETKCREEAVLFRGVTVLHFLGVVVTRIQLSASAVDVETNEEEDAEQLDEEESDDDDEEDGEDEEYAFFV